jgi:hypothetical protein
VLTTGLVLCDVRLDLGEEKGQCHLPVTEHRAVAERRLGHSRYMRQTERLARLAGLHLRLPVLLRPRRPCGAGTSKVGALSPVPPERYVTWGWDESPHLLRNEQQRDEGPYVTLRTLFTMGP